MSPGKKSPGKKGKCLFSKKKSQPEKRSLGKKSPSVPNESSDFAVIQANVRSCFVPGDFFSSVVFS